MLKKFVTTIALVAAIGTQLPAAPVIFKSEAFFDDEFSVTYFDCYATNLDYGTLWIFETNSDLLTTNWATFSSSYYIGFGSNYSVPYISPAYDTSWTPQVFMRMRQVGADFHFYPGFDLPDMSAYDPESESSTERLSLSERRFTPESTSAIRVLTPVDISILMPPTNVVLRHL